MSAELIFAKCGNCECDVDSYMTEGSECTSLTYTCYECKLAWNSDGRGVDFEEWDA